MLASPAAGMQTPLDLLLKAHGNKMKDQARRVDRLQREPFAQPQVFSFQMPSDPKKPGSLAF